MKTVVVTGANSFLGVQIVKKLSLCGFRVISVVRDVQKTAGNIIEKHSDKIVSLKMSEYKDIYQKTGEADIFINLAWEGTRGNLRNDATIQERNCKSVTYAINDMIEHGTQKIILAGSQAEYGNLSGEVFEYMPCSPMSEYGKWKYRLFEDSQKICSGNGVLCVEPRIFSLYGPGDYEKSLVMMLINAMRNNEKCELTSCEQMWDYLFVEDAADAFVSMCNANNIDGPYNLCGNDIRTLKEYVEELKAIIGSASEIRYGTVGYTVEKQKSMYLNGDKLKSALGWIPAYTFEQGIKRIIYTSHSLGAL